MSSPLESLAAFAIAFFLGIMSIIAIEIYASFIKKEARRQQRITKVCSTYDYDRCHTLPLSGAGNVANKKPKQIPNTKETKATFLHQLLL